MDSQSAQTSPQLSIMYRAFTTYGTQGGRTTVSGHGLLSTDQVLAAYGVKSLGDDGSGTGTVTVGN